MNYIWELLIHGKQNGMNQKEIIFTPAKVFSPYMELSFECMNATNIAETIEINPYYRFGDIFQTMLDPNLIEDTDMMEALFDIAVHFIAKSDMMQGMCKREYHINFVIQDIESGIFGKGVQQSFMLFNHNEKNIIANNLLHLYRTGEAVFLLKDTIQKIFTTTIILANAKEKDELIFYIQQKEDAVNQKKLQFIQQLFMPFRFQMEIYWDTIFGIIGVEKLMEIDKIVIY